MSEAKLLADIERAASEMESAHEKRDKLIRQALAEGLSLRTVATAAGLYHGAVAFIRDKEV